MKPKLQRLEVEPVGPDDDDLAVEDAALGQLRLQHLDQFRVVPVERLGIAALDENLVAITEDERPEAVPFRLEEPVVALRQRRDALGQHRQDRRVGGEVHPASIRSAVTPAKAGIQPTAEAAAQAALAFAIGLRSRP